MFRKIFICALIIVYLCYFCPVSNEAWASGSSLPISAKSVVLLDPITGHIVYAKNPHLKRAPASTVKLMTAMVALDRLNPDYWVTVSHRAAAQEPTKAYIKPGERYRLGDLLKATLISSSNDAAYAVAEAVAGSEKEFVRLMNKKARKMGLRRTRFGTCNGLPGANQYSTAYDMTRIVRTARKYPFIYDNLKKKRETIFSSGDRRIFLRNHNKMLWRKPDKILGKTGFTRKALYCFVGCLDLGKKEMIVTLFGSLSPWRDLSELFDFIFDKEFKRKIAWNRRHLSKGKVRKLQYALRKAGFSPGSVDGVFGERTLWSVIKFQKANRLTPDGIVGSNTWDALSRYM